MFFSLTLLLFIAPITVFSARNESNSYSCGPLYVTVSAKPKTYIVLNWLFTCEDPPDKVILLIFDSFFSHTPRDSVSVVNKRSGSYKTNFVFPLSPTFPGHWDENDLNPIRGSHCFPFYVQSERNGSIIDRQCMRIFPSWMENYRNVRIGELMIPGTHNGGAWEGPNWLFKNYALNQDRNFWQQLVFGIRYFDIRVGIYSKGIYITHDFAKTTLLEPELDHVINFVKKSPKEIVILDFHQFNRPKNFTINDHRIILELLHHKLGPYLYGRPYVHQHNGPKMEDVWQSGKNIILCYGKPQLVAEKPWLWYPMSREWGDEISVTKLQNYIYNRTAEKPHGNPMSALMAELTPTVTYVITHPTKSLGYLADKINPKLAFWLRDNNRSDNVNVIATDFFLGNDMINLAIETNNRKIVKLP